MNSQKFKNMNWINDQCCAIRKNSSQRKKQRQFGGLFLVIIGVLLAVSFFKNGFLLDVKQIVLSSVFFTLSVLTLVLPKILSPFLFIWLFIGFVFGEITSFIIMGILYYCFLSPMVVFLRLKSKKENKNGWINKENKIDYKKLY